MNIIPAFLAVLLAAAHAFPAGPAASRQNLPAGIKPIPTTNIHNAFQLTKTTYSGSTPDNEAAFIELQNLGIKTILSVDGSRPNVELARKYRMRYIHIPHGYDGISTNTQVQLIKAAQLSPEPIYIHCHHGLHRGPAAAAVICLGKEGWTPAFAEEWMRAAGTGSNYTGLYQAMRHFRKPSPEQLRSAPSSFPETATVSGLVDSMVAIDTHWEYFKAYRKSGYQPLKHHPDITPAHEAMILREQFREAQRLEDSAKLGSDFIEQLKKSETLVQALEKSLREREGAGPGMRTAELDRHMGAIGQACAACHKKYRD